VNEFTKKILLDNILLVSVFFLLSVFYINVEHGDIRHLQLFPWDSGLYRELAEKFFINDGKQIEAIYPFGPRLLFPYLYGYLANHFLITYSNAAFFVNLFSSLLVTLFAFSLWRVNGIKRSTAWIGILLFMMLAIGPLRSSIYYPGGGGGGF
jgi:hypothetical protein